MKKLLIISFVAAVAANSFGQEFYNVDATKIWEGQIGTKANTGLGLTENASYSNVTNFTGFAFSNGGAALIGANTITKMNIDDLLTLSPSTAIEQFSFTVSNLNTAATSARPRVRFYADNGSGAPGNLLAGFTFNAISFTAGTVATFSANVGSFMTTPADGKIWAGITFDNNSGATGATVTTLNNLGQGIFDPPTQGSSADSFWATTNAGDFLSNNPAGSSLFFGGSPKANFGWSLTAVPEPASMAVLGLGLLGLVSRRRKSSK